MEKMIIRCVKNEYFVKVKRCCASCLHKEITNEGARVCALMELKVEQMFRCKKWQMSKGLENAGKSGGVVKDKETKEVVIR